MLPPVDTKPGFSGSNIVHFLIEQTGVRVTVLDKLTYAGNRESLKGVPEDRLELVVGDITDAALVSQLRERADAVVH